MTVVTASSEDFPSVTLDADATQKFAEIEVQWGEWQESCGSDSKW